MSSVVVSTSAALGRPFVFDDEAEPELRLPASASRASLDPFRFAQVKLAEDGCPHINLQEHGRQDVQESPLARVQSAIRNQKSKIPPARVTPASQLDIRPAPEMVSCGIPALDALTGGLPRGCLTEICGPASSGRTTVLLAALAAATRRGEFCVVVDASDVLDPQSAVAAGVDLSRLLWVRCSDGLAQTGRSPQRYPSTSLRASSDTEQHSSQTNQSPINQSPEDRVGSCNPKPPSENCLEQVLRATDLLLESGGFGLIALDLGDLPLQAARRIPLTTWFRFRRAVEPTPTILLAIEPYPIAGSCSTFLLQLGLSSNGMLTSEESAAKRRKNADDASHGFTAEDIAAPEGRKKITLLAQSAVDFPYPTHAQLFTGLDITAELIRSRLDRKPIRSAAFATKTAWAG
jgi:recombination protein RecA